MSSEVSFISARGADRERRSGKKSILMIGGIKVFLPYSPDEASMCVSEVATTKDRQPAETVTGERRSRANH
jgi:hypothetical protein